MKSPYPSPEARYQYHNRTFSNAIDSTPRWKLTMYFSAHGISPQQSFFMTERMMFTTLRRPRQDNPGKKPYPCALHPHSWFYECFMFRFLIAQVRGIAPHLNRTRSCHKAQNATSLCHVNYVMLRALSIADGLMSSYSLFWPIKPSALLL